MLNLGSPHSPSNNMVALSGNIPRTDETLVHAIVCI